jgi:hypothetical protein
LIDWFDRRMAAWLIDRLRAQQARRFQCASTPAHIALPRYNLAELS